VLSVEHWAEVRRLHRAEGLPIKMIARVLTVSWNTARDRWRPVNAPHLVALVRAGSPRWGDGGSVGRDWCGRRSTC
jgi:hypothetical protein